MNRQEPKSKNAFFTSPNPEDREIYINDAKTVGDQDIDLVSNLIAHEEMHNVLKDINIPASSGLDILTPPIIKDYDNDGILNPKTAGRLSGVRDTQSVLSEIGKNKYEKQNVDDRMHHYFNQVLSRTNRLEKDKQSLNYVDDDVNSDIDNTVIDNFDNDYNLNGDEDNQIQEGEPSGSDV